MGIGETIQSLMRSNSVAAAVADALNGVLEERVRLVAAGAEDPPHKFLRHAEIADVVLKTDAGVMLLVPEMLPPGHWARTLLSADDLYRQNNQTMLVLGTKALLYPADKIKDVTLSWSIDSRREIAKREAQKRQAEDDRRRQFREQYETEDRLQQLERQVKDLKKQIGAKKGKEQEE
jgi:hypothetical protein